MKAAGVLKVISIIFAVLTVSLGILLLIPSWTPEIEGEKFSVSEIAEISVGGMSQYLLIRGVDRRKPVILFLHGGPGTGDIGTSRVFQEELEKHFVIVRWDQRGAGLSYDPEMPKEDLSIKQILNDTYEVSDYLKSRFSQDKIFLAGHSSGTVLGLYAAEAHPEKYHGYIGISQFAHGALGEEMGYYEILERAEKINYKEAVQALKEIGPPPYRDMHEMIDQRRWAGELGGMVYREVDFMKPLLLSTEYNLKAKLNYMKGAMLSAELLLDDILAENFFDSVQKVDVPLLFIGGKYDCATPAALSEKLLNSIEAPVKQFSLFEESAHMPQIEEGERFLKELLLFTERVLSVR